MANLKHTIKEHNVTLLDDKKIILHCNVCSQTWSPNIQSGKRLPKGYWQCPNKCNYQEKEYKHTPDVRAYFAQRNREQNQKRGLKL